VRYATSNIGTLTGPGGDIIIVDGSLKSEEARSDVKPAALNDWHDQTLVTLLNDKRGKAIKNSM